MATEATEATTQLTGCVKWFDNGLNYGFITVLTEGEHRNADIFVHQSNIQTKRDCFRTLYTGECVQFSLAKSDNEKHPVHAINVAGYNGTMLHCENPNYRPRGFRGGRGGSRGGSSGRGGFSARNQRAGNVANTGTTTGTTTATATATATDNEVAPVEATEARQDATTQQSTSETTVVAGASRGRGRGRARGKTSAV